MNINRFSEVLNALTRTEIDFEPKSAAQLGGCCKLFYEVVHANNNSEIQNYWRAQVLDKFKSYENDYRFNINVNWSSLFFNNANKCHKMQTFKKKIKIIKLINNQRDLDLREKEKEEGREYLSCLGDNVLDRNRVLVKIAKLSAHDSKFFYNATEDEKQEIIVDYCQLLLEDNKSKYKGNKSKEYKNFYRYVDLLDKNELSRENANCKAQYFIALNYSRAHFSDYLREWRKESSKKDALTFCKLSADQGYALAQNLYGDLLAREKDYKGAFEFYQLSAEQGYAMALSNLANCYRSAQGTDIDMQAAFNCYERLAELGDIEGQFNLATCYEEGLGTVVDMQKAIAHYQLSAANGNETAQVKLLNFYLENSNFKMAFQYGKPALDRAKVVFTYMAKKIKDSEVKSSILGLLEYAGNLEEAIIKATDDNAKAQNFLVDNYKKEGGIKAFLNCLFGNFKENF